jgi:hypothetical protein
MMAAKYIGIPQATLSDRVIGIGDDKHLKNPSGKTFRVIGISGRDGNEYLVIEAGDWFSLAADVLVNPGKTRKATKEKIAECRVSINRAAPRNGKDLKSHAASNSAYEIARHVSSDHGRDS